MYRIKSKDSKDTASRRDFNEGSNDIIVTPDWLARKIWKIALTHWRISTNIWNEDTKPHSILDPCCGDGVLFKYIPTWKNTIYAYDILPIEGKLPHITYKQCNFLTEPYDAKYNFSIILMNPPFSEKNPTGGTTKFVERCLERMGDKSVLVTIVPTYFVDNSERRKEWLSTLIEKRMVLPKHTFATKVSDKPQPLHSELLVIKKNCSNKFFLFKD